MFLSNKRNFSLRGSPSKLSHVTSSPLRSGLLVANSPAKRFKLSDPVQPMSSTFLQDRTLDEESKPEFPDGENIILAAATTVNTAKANLFETEESLAQQDTTIAGNVSAVVTPPPTPEVRNTSKFETISKQRSKLVADIAELDRQINERIKEFTEVAAEIGAIKARKYKLEDFSAMMKEKMGSIRDLMNSIFKPGNELAQKFESTMREVHAMHKRKLEGKVFEWNSYLSQTKSAIAKRTEAIKHEIDLHRRTVAHREHLIEQARALSEKNSHQSDAVDNADAEQQSPVSIQKDPVNMNDDIQGDQLDDCIILDASDDPNIGHEEVITEQSNETSQVKTETMDGDETEVDDDHDEESRSFTPCQAQRVD